QLRRLAAPTRTQQAPTGTERYRTLSVAIPGTGSRFWKKLASRCSNFTTRSYCLMVYGKGGPYGTRSKRRVIPLTSRVQPLLEGHFALHASVVGEQRPPTLRRVARRCN